MTMTTEISMTEPLEHSRRDFLRVGSLACITTAAAVAGFPQTTLAQSLSNIGVSVSVDQAARWLRFSTFAPLDSEILDVATRGYASWLETQMLLPQSRTVSDWVRLQGPPGFEDPNQLIAFTERVRAIDWKCVYAADQFRQRVTYALSNIFVVSTLSISAYICASFWDTLNKHAFGNFRELIEAITYSVDMGIYLTYMNNSKGDAASGRQPDENYARELMQLFTIGLWELNEDGSRKIDSKGHPIPTYSQADVTQMARVFTGLYANGTTYWGEKVRFGFTNFSAFSSELWASPMQADDSRHSPESVRALDGRVDIPAGTSCSQAIRKALDALFQHPSCPPFIALNLIRRLTCSNPSPAYVTRVSRAFVNNGQGVRGDMKAVLRAIFLDPDLLTPGTPRFGMLTPRYVYTMGAARRLGCFSNPLTQRVMSQYDHTLIGSQRPFTAPTVFNFNRPDFTTPELRALELVGPELENCDEYGASQVFTGLGHLCSNATLTPNLSLRLISADNDAALLDELSRRLSGKVLPDGDRSSLLSILRGIGRTQVTYQRQVLAAMLWTILIHPQNMVLS
ncbi:DUF1800 family protein [Aquariibacter albus]|uniref:DUF1800 family protein n=1 Tax=Aquariibacter albus TaxID=2759899 RepID=A0A839HGY9_9BURK|nr:DUF1800 family protein [Aquariibacter albus]MBB1160943.1 DUF1800 family protein [Aquariibacter albus]